MAAETVVSLTVYFKHLVVVLTESVKSGCALNYDSNNNIFIF